MQEEELRASGDPKFQHLSEELHVEISAFATPAEAHARIAYALAEVRRFLVPVSQKTSVELILPVFHEPFVTNTNNFLPFEIRLLNCIRSSYLCKYLYSMDSTVYT